MSSGPGLPAPQLIGFTETVRRGSLPPSYVALTHGTQVSSLTLQLPNGALNFTDRTGERFFHLTVPWWAVMVGYIISLSTASIGGRYFAMFLMASGYAGQSDMSGVSDS